MKHGYSVSNIAFGMGGQLLQAHNRDTLKFAMKCSSITVDGKERDVFKDPVTDHGKVSKAGRLDLVKWSNGKFETVRLPVGKNANEFSLMRTVYENGELLVDDNFETIRNRVK
jgi:nicotinamide phosphoribosyltransferase